MTACASADSLEQFLHGELTEPEASALRAHVHSCPTCQVVLDRLSDHPQLRQWAGGGRVLAIPETTPVGLLANLRGTAQPETTDTALDFSPSTREQTAATATSARLGPYRILGELGRGGMGVVLKAYDTELERVVAVKVLREGHADARARERFVREARAAAGLKHDHVVAIHAVANPTEGPPYFVMEYVAGPTLHERIKAERGLGAREAAAICRQVADGLAAAHRARLIHRDVKPANILLDPPPPHLPKAGKPDVSQSYERGAGRAKISDFGLVRVKEQPSATTQDGAIRGTPEYMSPEQIREPDHIDERSDVYSLGVTLYEALTGEVPFRGATLMVLQQVLTDDPVPARRLNDQIPRDLETICLKAMAKEPSRRFQSAIELRDDLQRWLNGEPIRARPVGRVERVWRWCRRKPALSSVTAALILVFVSGFASVFWQWRRAESQWLRAEANLVDANEQRGRAKERSRQARRTVDDLLTEIGFKELHAEPAMTATQRRLLERALRHYQGFLAEEGDDPELRFETGRAFARMGMINRVLGRHAEAETHFASALALFEELSRQFPNEPEYPPSLVDCHVRFGLLLAHSGRLAHAEARFRQGLEVAERMARAFPNSTRGREGTANVLHRLGQHLSNSDAKVAETHFRRAIELGEGLKTEAPAVLTHRRELASTYNDYATLLHRNRRPLEAEKTYGLARELYEQLVTETADPDVRLELAQAHGNLAYLWATIGRGADAEPAYRRSIDLKKKLVLDFPERPEFKASLANSLTLYGYFHRLAQRVSETLSASRQASVHWRELAEAYPEVPDYHSQFGGALNNLAMDLWSQGENRQAREVLEEAVRHQKQALQINPKNRTYRTFLNNHFFVLAQVLANLGEAGQAERLYRDHVAMAQRFVDDSKDAADREILARAHTNLGRLLRSANQLAEAEGPYRQAIAVWQGLATEFPKTADYQSEWGATLNDLVRVLREQGKLDEALVVAQQAIRRQDEALSIHPQHAGYRANLMRHYYNLALVHVHQGRHEEAVQIATDMPTRFPGLVSEVLRAQVLASSAPVAEQDGKLSTDQREKLAKTYADGAMELLHQTAKKGALLVLDLQSNEFKPIGHRPDFQNLLADLEAKTKAKPK